MPDEKTFFLQYEKTILKQSKHLSRKKTELVNCTEKQPPNTPSRKFAFPFQIYFAAVLTNDKKSAILYKRLGA
jgi:hypothetical protein